MQKESQPISDSEQLFNLSRRNVMKAAAATGVGLSGLTAISGSATAAAGDSLGTVDLPNTDSFGVGITFTGDHVIAPNSITSTELDIYEPPAGGDGTATHVATKTLPELVGGIEWDPSREKLWATEGTDGEFWLVDIGNPTVTETLDSADMTLQFTLPSGKRGWPPDGLARDGSDDTLWWSYNNSGAVWKLATADGSELREIIPEINDAGDPLAYISGVAVGADKDDRPTLYLGDNETEAGADVNKIVRVFADDGENIQTFTDVEFRVEDIVCDPVTYEPSEALLVRDGTQYQAFEVEQGTCPIAGCDPSVTVDLIADGGSDATEVVIGTVEVSDLNGDISVTYSLMDDWFLRETHLHIAGDDDEDGSGDCDRIPQNKKGNPKVGHFALSRDYGPGVQEDTYLVSQDGASNVFGEDFSDGEALCIAAHAAVFQDENDNDAFDPDVDREESAWGEGDRFVDRGNWAMHFDYQNPCEENPFTE